MDRLSSAINRRTLLIAAIASAITARHDAQSHTIQPAPINGFELPEPKALQASSLRTHARVPFSSRDLGGRWSFVFFGFTHCPDVCPTTLAELRRVRAAIGAARDTAPNRVLFVTIDPARDTDARLAEYIARFGPGVTALNGSANAIKTFADQFRVKYEIAGNGTATKGSYLFDHTASVSLVGPDARLYAVFTLPLRTQAVANDVLRIHAKHRADLCANVSGRHDTLTCIAKTV
jgi:protein SCO1/2